MATGTQIGRQVGERQKIEVDAGGREGVGFVEWKCFDRRAGRGICERGFAVASERLSFTKEK